VIVFDICNNSDEYIEPGFSINTFVKLFSNNFFVTLESKWMGKETITKST